MKKMMKFLSLALVLMLVLSLAACSGKSTIDNTWKYDLDFAKAMSMSGEDEEIPDEFKDAFKDITVQVVMDLKADGTYTLGVDEESAKAAVPKMVDAMKAVLPDLLKTMFGEDTDIDALLAQQNMTMDDVLKQFTEELDADELTEELTKSAEKGTYTFEEGKLTLTPEEGNAVVYTAELSGSKLTITAIEGESDMNEALKAMLPLEFYK